MIKFRIENTRSGAIVFECEAATEAEALDKMARHAGYADYADVCECAPSLAGEIIVTRR